MLLVLMLAVAVLTITLLGVARNYRRSIVRDREVEMMHRGDQYSRAIKRYYKKNGSYPTSLEQLEKANNIRYLRRRYKDPMTADGVWKLVHLTDVTLASGAGLAGAAANASAPGNPNPANAGDLSSTATAAAVQNPDNSNTGASTGGTSTGVGTSGTATGTTTGTTGTPAPGTAAGGSAFGSTGTNNDAASGQVLGGGGVLGVVSKSKAEGIHSFGDKTKYNEWFFIYDPSQDKGQMLVGPYNPNMYLGATVAAPGSPGPGSGTGGVTGSAGAPGPGSSNPLATPAPSIPTSPAPTPTQ